MSSSAIRSAVFLLQFTVSSGALISQAPVGEQPSRDWWRVPAMDIIDSYAPGTSVNLVCVEHDCITYTTLSRIDKAVLLWNTDSDNVTIPSGNEWAMFAVFLSYDNALLDFVTKHDTSAKPLYLFVLPVDSNDDDVSAVFDVCLAQYIIRAVALVPRIIEMPGQEDLKSMLAYTFNPFINSSNCSDTTPSLIFSWNITDYLKAVIRPIPDRQVRNMRGCSIRVAARTSETNLMITPARSDAMGNWSLEGPWSRVFFAILQGMNARLDLRKADEENFPDEHEAADEMFFGRFSSNEERYLFFDFPSAARVQCYTYCVPRAETHDPVWFLLVGEYTVEVWLLMLLTMIAAAILYIPMQRWKSESLGFSLFYFFAAVNSSMHPRPKWDSARIVFVLWSLFVLVMTTAYQGTLQGFRTSPRQLDLVKTVGDLLESSLIIRGPPVLIKVLQNLYEDTSGYNLRSRLLPYAEGEDIDEESLSEQYVHMCSSVEFITLNLRKKRHSDGRLRYYKILHHCSLTQSEILVLLPKHSPFLPLLSEIILRLTEGGLLAHIMDVPEPFDIITVGVQAIGLSRLKSPLTLLGIGCSAAFLVFVAEIRGSMEWT